MTRPVPPPAGEPPPSRRAALLDRLLAERYGPPVRGKPFRGYFEADTAINQAIRRHLLAPDEEEDA